ncbi:MAG TPA: hypothetical protein VHT24_15775 [Pseudacidobacterium sp.]|jgi:hypothetical protein|nr:hypothetical protein [Pseudacidobacterium sp.]
MRETISIWFFAGVLFLIYGVIITAAGVWALIHPPLHPPVLSHLHPAIWWGALMAIAGLVYTIRFRPRARR